MYPESEAFKEALRQARERAAAVNRQRSQVGAPDPPESGVAAARNQKVKAKERRGLMSPPTAASGRVGAQQPTPPQPDRVAERAVAPGPPAASAMYPSLSMQSRLAAMPHDHSPVTGDSLMQRLQWRDLQARMALRQEQVALLAGAHGMPGRPHWGAQPGMLPLSAEDRWRMAQGLHPTFAAGRGALHQHSLVARGGLLGPQSPAVPLEADNTDEAGLVASKESTAGDDMMNMLAAAAEDTLRREEQQKAMESEDKAEDDIPPANVAEAPVTTAKPAKRKRKAANEPKNPLGAFVFYQRKIMADVFEENPCITFGEAAAECGRRWRELPDGEKMAYKNMAAADKERYTIELATFKSKKDDPLGLPVVPKKESAKVLMGRKKKVGPEVEPKRARSAFQFYKAEEIVRVKQEFPNVTTSEAATECSARYKALTKNQKQKYEKLAADDRARYRKDLGGASPKKADEKKIPAEASSSDKRDPPEAPSDEDEGEEEEHKETEKAIEICSPPAQQKPTQIKYGDMVDPNPYYAEESAWRYHNPPLPPSREAVKKEDQMQETPFPYVSHEELRPVPPPPPPPTNFPDTPFCRWTYDEDTRVLLADFRRPDEDVVVTLEDEKYLLESFERDDITVVSEGLLSGLDPKKWTLDFLSRVSGDEYYHRFRRFDKDPSRKLAPTPAKKAKKNKADVSNESETEETETVTGAAHAEIDTCISMKVTDYVTYLRKREAAVAALGAGNSSERVDGKELCSYSFKDHKGELISIDVTKTVLYMLDYDMVKLLPTLYDDFVSCYKLRGAMPGGSHCMMNSVTSNGRPFMGPNLYVTPPGSFTHFHQDGHGTVDSGHICLSGYNEVVIIRRLTERAKRHALSLLTGNYKNKKGPSFEGLYDLPHADLLGEKPQWPDNEAVAKCNEMNYCVSRFILRQGQCVHINKGRLHAFRKVTNEPLPADDCHAKLRANLMIPGTNEPVVGPGKPEVLCISVAWDWMFRGVTASGINREIVSTLECAALNRKYGAMSLAIPELSLIQMARTLAPKVDEKTSGKSKTVAPGSYRESLIGFSNNPDRSVEEAKGFMPDPSVICKGIFPALQYVVKQHIHAINVAESLKSKSFERCKRVSVAKNPNAWENPVNHPLDPYGNTDFFCKLCSKELSNVYLHCDGCEILLSKDFNICLECHQEKRYAKPVQMHPLNNKRHSTINHIGNMQYDRASRCPCKNGPVCRHCNYCSGCSCRCHTFFTLNFRFFKREDELKLLHRVKLAVGREELEAAEEAEKRLSMAVRGRFVDVGAGGPYGLHCMDVIVDPESVRALVEEVDETMSQDESEPGQDPPSPIRKSRRMLEDNPEPMETSPDSDDAASVEMGDASLNENGMLINVKDMKVTIRCPPGAFAKGPGIDHIDLTTFAGEVQGGSADCPDPRSQEDTESNELNESDGVASVDDDVGDRDSHSVTTPKAQVEESNDADTEPEAQNKEEEDSLNDDSGEDTKPTAKTQSILGGGMMKNVSASVLL